MSLHYTTLIVKRVNLGCLETSQLISLTYNRLKGYLRTPTSSKYRLTHYNFLDRAQHLRVEVAQFNKRA